MIFVGEVMNFPPPSKGKVFHVKQVAVAVFDVEMTVSDVVWVVTVLIGHVGDGFLVQVLESKPKYPVV